MNFEKIPPRKSENNCLPPPRKRGNGRVSLFWHSVSEFAAVCVIFCCMGIGAFRAILDTAGYL